jgi:radical SAM protein with 4Fe4S-binding SPASM domain
MISSIEPTNACGYKCKMCPRRHMTRPIGFMDIGLFRKIVSQMKHQKIVTLHGFGDPLLHPKMGEMIDIVHDAGIQAAFSTNPQTLTPENTKMILESGLDRLHISLDGATKETYEAIRGGAADYDKAVSSLNYFLKEKLEKNGFGKPYVIVAIIHMKETEEEIEKFKSQWHIHGVDEVQVKPFIKWDGTDAEINKMGETRKKDNDFACFWPWSRLVVLWDGRAVPCCYDYDGKMVIGDLNKQTVKEIWNSEKMKAFREMQLGNYGIMCDLCAKCKEKEGSPPSKWFPFNLLWKKKLNLLSYFKFN